MNGEWQRGRGREGKTTIKPALWISYHWECRSLSPAHWKLQRKHVHNTFQRHSIQRPMELMYFYTNSHYFFILFWSQGINSSFPSRVRMTFWNFKGSPKAKKLDTDYIKRWSPDVRAWISKGSVGGDAVYSTSTWGGVGRRRETKRLKIKRNFTD